MLPLAALPRLAASSKTALGRPSLSRTISKFVEPPTRITTLPNQLKVATNDVAAHIQSVGVTVAAGSRYEVEETRGYSYMLAKMAFKSSSNRSVTDYALDMEKYVSNLACHMGRETLLYQAHFPAQNISPVLSLVSDTMLHPLLTEQEVEESLFAASYELQLYDEKVDAYLMEVLQDVAFGGRALGRSNLPAVEAVNPDTHGNMPSLITAEGLRLFREKWFRPERIVISGTGMEHEALVELAQAQFGHLPYHPPSLSPSASSDSLAPLASPASSSSSSSSSSSVQTWFQSLLSATPSSTPGSSVSSGSPPSSPSSGKSFATTSSPASSLPSLELPSVPPVGQPMTVYTGGVSIDVREEMEMAHVFVGCEGVDANSDDVYALAVIQMLLGDGASFSSGGPGKGLLSRFYTGVMSGSYGIDNVNSLNLPYSDAGLFAVSLTCEFHVLKRYLDRLALELASLLSPSNPSYPVLPIELSRAKNRLKSAMLYAREDVRVEAEDLGAQVLMNGYRLPIGDMIQRIDDVSMADLQRVARRVFVDGVGNGELTIVARGPKEVRGVASMVRSAWRAKGLNTGSL